MKATSGDEAQRHPAINTLVPTALHIRHASDRGFGNVTLASVPIDLPCTRDRLARQ